MKPLDDSLPPGGRTLRLAFERLVAALNERSIHYAIIGGLAANQFARARATDDINVLLSIPQIALPEFIEALRKEGFQVDLARNIREYKDDGITSVRFESVLVDLMRPVIPACTHVLDRAMTTELFGHNVRLCSAEGLVVLKLMAMRLQDEADIENILAAFGASLDFEFIQTELESFAGPDDPRHKHLAEWVRRATADE